MAQVTTLRCMRGRSADREVLLGFAPAAALHVASFADVLDEGTGRGYQRRLNPAHSLDFRRYVQREGSATIPLTFNLRGSEGDGWRLVEEAGATNLVLEPGRRPLAQVDCQHRLGHLSDLSAQLPFMTFVGLTEREETDIFRVINGKAKGLSTSLLDFHDAQLCRDIATERPELLVALHLKNEPTSPWCNRLDCGGNAVSGLDRRASLRTMQKAARLFLRRLRPIDADEAARLAHDFWAAVATVMPDAFARPRASLVSKGVGVYALMQLAADMVAERRGSRPDARAFAADLNEFAPQFDWSNKGPLAGLGGEGGAAKALDILRAARRRSRLKVANG